MASRQLFDAVPFYAGLTLEEIGGKGVRWQERPQASAYSAGDRQSSSGGAHALAARGPGEEKERH
jgi:NADH-quinone oxidoreductase subunit G